MACTMPLVNDNTDIWIAACPATTDIPCDKSPEQPFLIPYLGVPRIRTKEADSSFQHKGGVKDECNCVQCKGGASAESQSQRNLRAHLTSSPSPPLPGPQQSPTWLPQMPLDRVFQVSPSLVSPGFSKLIESMTSTSTAQGSWEQWL